MVKYTLDKQLAFNHPDWDVDFSIWTGSTTLLHNHCFYELFIVLEGSLSHTCNNKTEHLQRGSLRFIHPSDTHKQKSEKSMQATTVNLSFTEDFLHECQYFSENASTLLSDASSAFLFTLNNEELNYINFLNNKILCSGKKTELMLIKQLLLLCFNKLPPHNKSLDKTDYPIWLSNLINDLQKPKNFTLPLHTLTQKTHYSNTTLAIEFKKHTGTTAVNFFQTAKLKYACRLLKYTDYSTLKIANLCGFFSLSHFNHIFKDFKGVTPIEYRKKHQPVYKN